MPDRERLASLDVGRAVAALLVVLYHGNGNAGVGSGLLQWGLVGVEFFMVLSGYVLARPYFEGPHADTLEMRALRFLWRRGRRILPAYWCALAIAVAVDLAGIGPERLDAAALPFQLVTHVTLTHSLFADTA